MAKQIGNIRITGTYDNLCFYKVKGAYYVRKKSSLTAKRVKTSPKFALTRLYADLMGRSSKIASAIYSALPADFRQYWMFKAFTGEALQWLKKGKSPEETKEILRQTYVSVWELKKKETQEQKPMRTKQIKTSNQDRFPATIKMDPTPVHVYATPTKRRTERKRKRSRVRRRKSYATGWYCYRAWAITTTCQFPSDLPEYKQRTIIYRLPGEFLILSDWPIYADRLRVMKANR